MTAIWLLFGVALVILFDNSNKNLVNAQYSPQSFPDPRIDPISCRITVPGLLCDPSDILRPDDRRSINEKLNKQQTITANIRNISPSCANSQRSNLVIMVALVEKLGALPFEMVNIEKFTNLLRFRYLNYQDTSQCDSLVLIVNSRTDRQVFTVAGRDARLSREILQNAFQRNVVHFRENNYALGLEGMIDYIVSSYGSVHTGSLSSFAGSDNSGSILPPPSNLVGSFVAAQGVKQKQEIKNVFEKLNLEDIPEDDRLWVQIIFKAAALCGYDSEKIGKHVRAVVEEAMTLSLKLISDTRYNKIEEDSQNSSYSRDTAWNTAKTSFIDTLYEKYGQNFPRRASQCPPIEEKSVISKLLRK